MNMRGPLRATLNKSFLRLVIIDVHSVTCMDMHLQQLFEIKTKNTIKAIKFVSDLRQVCGFLWVLWFPPPIKLTATI